MSPRIGRMWTVALLGLSVLMLGAATLALLLLPDQIAEYRREPEDVYLGVFWSIVPLVVGLFLARLAVGTQRRARQPRLINRVIRGGIAAFGLLLIVMGVFSRVDGYWMIPSGLVCIVLAVMSPGAVKRE